MSKVRLGPIVPYFTGGIYVVHVEDVVTGFLAALKRGLTGQRYVLGGQNMTYRAIVERAARAMGLRRRFVPVPPFVTGIAMLIRKPLGRLPNRRPLFTYSVHYSASRHNFYDSSKARRALGYTPRDFDAILGECLRLGVC